MQEYQLVMRPVEWNRQKTMRCPFCGRKDDVWIVRYEHPAAGTRFAVRCIDCGVTVDNGVCKTQWKALDVWNARYFTAQEA